MSARLLRIGALSLLALWPSASAAAAALDEVAHFEMDVVFPRNETYLSSDIFPIALAIQNLTAVRTLGDFDVIWGIMPYRDGIRPGGVYYDEGWFPIPEPGEEDEDGNYVFVANSNVTSWIGHKKPYQRYSMQFYVQWHAINSETCDATHRRGAVGSIMFSVEAPWEAEKTRWWQSEDDDEGVPPDVMDVPECPEFGAVVEVRPNPANASCPIILDKDTGRDPDPCRVVVDSGVANNIKKRAEKLAEEAMPTETDDADQPEESEDAASGVGPPGVALAAACALSWLAVAW